MKVKLKKSLSQIILKSFQKSFPSKTNQPTKPPNLITKITSHNPHPHKSQQPFEISLPDIKNHRIIDRNFPPPNLLPTEQLSPNFANRIPRPKIILTSCQQNYIHVLEYVS